MASGCYVAYFRVSTDRQGRSGLGLDAQRDAVAAFLDGGDCKVVAEFQEVESGRDDDRPELDKAVTRCRLTGSKLLIAKMDRLARRVSFVANLPGMTRFTAHIYAAVGEEEARMISERTRSALAAVKARGEKRLGNPQGVRGQGLPGRRQGPRPDGRRLCRPGRPLGAADARGGPVSAGHRGTADGHGHPHCPCGGEWAAATVKGVLDRLG